MNLDTYAEKTWCPGCGNYGILAAFKLAVEELVKENEISKNEIATVTGIGCHGKIFDYLNMNGFYGLHGRVIPTAIGIRLGNPKIKVVGFGGDGDTYNEGIAHFVHACRYNPNITMIVHDNQIYALTVGQPTATTEEGKKTKVTPFGNPYKQMNPIVIALEEGATFVARSYAFNVPHLKNIIKEGILHKGFAFIDVLQPCLVFHDTRKYIQERIYEISPMSKEEALEKAKEWDYSLNPNARIPIGIFYKEERETLDESIFRK